MKLLERLTMRIRSRDTVGIDVGRRAVKAVRRTGGHVVARNLVRWDAPAALGSDESEQVLANVLRRAVATFGLRRRHRAVCALSLSFGTLRTFEFPEATPGELREMAQQEFLVDLGCNPNELEVAVWSATGPSGMHSVCGWALEERASRCVSAACTAAGLDCAAIDALPFALARAASSPADGTPNAVVDWGADGASLTIIQRGRPVFTRVLPDCGHQRIVERLAEALGLSTDEGWEFFDNFGPRADAAPEMRQLVREYGRDVAKGLATEIERTLDFLDERMPDLVPDLIVLFGGAADLARDTLRDVLGMPVEVWSEPTRTTSVGPAAPAIGTATSLANLEVGT